MKKVYAVNACVLVIIFLTAGIIARPSDYNREMKNLISQRTEVLNEFYDGRRDFDASRDKLELLEAGKLLKNDVAAMKTYQSTDIDQVVSYKIKIKSCKKTSYGIIKGKAEIRWVMRSVNDTREEKHSYFFTGEINQKNTKLTQLKKI